jgi:flagellar basal body-associated protein FliL
MADKAEKKPDAAAKPEAGGEHGAKDAKKGGGGLLTKLPVLLGGVMILEAAVLFAGFKFLGGGAPKSAPGAELVEEHDEEGGAHGEANAEAGHESGGHGESGDAKPAKKVDKKRPIELPVVDFKAPNKVSGRTFLFDVSIFAVTKGANEEKVKSALKDREALIKDRVRTIIAQADPEKLLGSSEPGLETLRRQVKYQLDEIIGEGLIDEVLVPRCIPMRTDF